MTPKPFLPYHGDTDGLIIQDHTSRLSRVEDSFQEILPIVSQTQTVIMGINESIQRIESNVEGLKEGHEGLSKEFTKIGKTVEDLDKWRNGIIQAKEERRRLIKKTVFSVVGTVFAAFIIYVLGFK